MGIGDSKAVSIPERNPPESTGFHTRVIDPRKKKVNKFMQKI